jgi:hypothetical protein
MQQCAWQIGLKSPGNERFANYLYELGLTKSHDQTHFDINDIKKEILVPNQTFLCISIYHTVGFVEKHIGWEFATKSLFYFKGNSSFSHFHHDHSIGGQSPVESVSNRGLKHRVPVFVRARACTVSNRYKSLKEHRLMLQADPNCAGLI